MHDTGFGRIMHIMQTMHFMHPGRGVREKPAEIAGEG